MRMQSLATVAGKFRNYQSLNRKFSVYFAIDVERHLNQELLLKSQQAAPLQPL